MDMIFYSKYLNHLKFICHNTYRKTIALLKFNFCRSSKLIGLDVNPVYIALAELRRREARSSCSGDSDNDDESSSVNTSNNRRSSEQHSEQCSNSNNQHSRNLNSTNNNNRCNHNCSRIIDRSTFELISFSFIPITYPEHDYYNQNVIQQTVAQALAKAKSKTKKVALAIPYSAVNSKNVSFNYNIQENAIEDFLKLNYEKYLGPELGQEIDTINFDYHVLDKHASPIATATNSNAALPQQIQTAASQATYQHQASITKTSAIKSTVNKIASQILSSTTSPSIPPTPSVTPTNSATNLKVVIADKAHVNKYASLLATTPLQLTVLDIDVYALARAIALIYPNVPHPYTIIYLDQERSLISVVAEQEEIICAQENFIDDPAKKSDKALLQYVLEQLQNLQNINSSINKNDVAAHVNDTEINYRQTNNSQLTNVQDAGIDHAKSSRAIILCGSSVGVFAELAAALKQNNDAAVIIANPFSKIKIAPHLEHYSRQLNQIAPAMMLCCGLAMHGMGTAEETYPLPIKFRCRPE